MNIHYKIVEVWPSDHLIVARYWTDELSEEYLASSPESAKREDGTPGRCRSDVSISLPIPEPSKEEIELMVQKNAPIAFLVLLETIKDPNINTDMNNSSPLKGITKTVSKEDIMNSFSPKINKPNESLTEEEILKLIG